MRKIINSLIIFAILFIITARSSIAYAQIFKFELVDQDQTIEVGSNFQVKVLINTGGEETINGDALVIFDPDKISIDSSQSGNFFTYFTSTPLSGVDNKYLLSSWEESVAHAKSSTSDVHFATISLRAKAAGTTALTFDCTAGTGADSNINRASDSKDIIKCSDLVPLSINIGSSGEGEGGSGGSSASNPTSTPTAVPSPTVTPTNTPVQMPTASELPRAGSTETTFTVLSIGTFLTMVGVLLVL